MPGWTTFANLIDLEVIQLVEEGVVETAARSAAEVAHQRLKDSKNPVADETHIWSSFDALPVRGDFAYIEPSDLDSIHANRDGQTPLLRFDPTDDLLFDKQYGAWLGRCAGCALGKPVECFMRRTFIQDQFVPSWKMQKIYLQAISPDEYPLKDYFPISSPAEERTGKLICDPSTRERIAFMETDDDIRYTVLGQIILSRYGRDFSSSHVAAAWIDLLGYRHVCSAETQAYRNIVIAGDALRGEHSIEKARQLDQTTDWRFITHHLNPYREWIGAQIRIDSYGYAAAGNPQLAAEFAWRDSRLSHVKNGIYGAMFCAAMIAASFATDDVNTIIQAGLSQIPKQSRLYHDIKQAIAICHRHDNDFARFEQVIESLHESLGHYDAVHTNNNAAACVAALLLSKGDFHQAITFAVMCGWDTDCNGATVGSIVGAIHGAKNCPKHWTARLNDTLNSYVVGYHPIAISECAKRACQIWKKVRG